MEFEPSNSIIHAKNTALAMILPDLVTLFYHLWSVQISGCDCLHCSINSTLVQCKGKEFFIIYYWISYCKKIFLSKSALAEDKASIVCALSF